MKPVNSDRALRIAIIGHKRIPSNEGGIEKGVEQHAVRMVALGHSVTAYNRGNRDILGRRTDGQKLKEYKGVRIVTIPAPNGSAAVPVYSFLATVHAIFSRYDVISYRASGPCAMIWLARLFRIRCVASLHGLDSQRNKWGGFARRYLRLGERCAARQANACLVLSENMRQYIRRTYGRDAICFANGIDAPRILPSDRIEAMWHLKKDNYILSLGRLEPEKNIDGLIQAFRRCRTEKYLVIAGGDSNHAYYQTLTELAAGDDRIIFTGMVSGDVLGELYSNPYLFVLPSLLEGMANTLLEAMSYGNCCLVSDIPENTEVTGDHAATFRSGDLNDLQEKLQYLLDHPDVTGDIRKGADTFILENHSWDLVVEQMLRIYRGENVDYQTVLREHRERMKS